VRAEMPCHITDGPSDPEDADDRWRAFDPDFAEYQQPDDYYDSQTEEAMTDTTDRSTRPDDLTRIFDRINSLGHELTELQAVLINQEPPAPQHDKLFKALAKAQTEIVNAEMDATNPHYGSQYASLDSVLKAIRGPLSKNGIAFFQLPGNKRTEKGDYLTLTSVLAHESGQSIENYFEMYPPKHDPQGVGSAMTYMRRYAAMALCGISGAYDDDAEGAKPEQETITPQEADQILALADELFGADADALLDRMCDKIFGVESVPKIPAGEAGVALQRIENTRKRKDREKEEAPAKEPAKPKKAAKPADDDVPVA